MVVACLTVIECYDQKTKRVRFLKEGEVEGKQRFTTLIGLCAFILRVLSNGIQVKATVAE